MCLTAFFNHTSAAASFTGVFSALIGFLIGAYMPVSILPLSIQNFANLIPGSHATGLFRAVLMRPILTKLEGSMSPETIEQIKMSYGFNLQLFNMQFDRTYMYLYLGVSDLILFVIFQIISVIKRKIKV
jgi:multidrug/hemolysin transport system permease protein